MEDVSNLVMFVGSLALALGLPLLALWLCMKVVLKIFLSSPETPNPRVTLLQFYKLVRD